MNRNRRVFVAAVVSAITMATVVGLPIELSPKLPFEYATDGLWPAVLGAVGYVAMVVVTMVAVIRFMFWAAR